MLSLESVKQTVQNLTWVKNLHLQIICLASKGLSPVLHVRRFHLGLVYHSLSFSHVELIRALCKVFIFFTEVKLSKLLL